MRQVAAYGAERGTRDGGCYLPPGIVPRLHNWRAHHAAGKAGLALGGVVGQALELDLGVVRQPDTREPNGEARAARLRGAVKHRPRGKDRLPVGEERTNQRSLDRAAPDGTAVEARLGARPNVRARSSALPT